VAIIPVPTNSSPEIHHFVTVNLLVKQPNINKTKIESKQEQ